MTGKETYKGSEEEWRLLNEYKKSKDQHSLGQLFQPYSSLVYGLCMKYFKNPQDAEDATMDIYLVIGERLQRHEVNNFKSWLYVVSKNHCLDKLRSKGSKIPKEKEAQLMYSSDVFHPDNVEDDERIKKLQVCLNQLPQDQKTCVNMFYYQKISYKDIVETTSYSWSQVRSFIQNGRRNLKNCIEKT